MAEAVTRAYEIATGGDTPTFIQAVLTGRASEDDVDDWTEVWHDHPEIHEGVGLQEFLGMDWTEYALWVRDPDAIGDIVESHRR